MPRRLFFGLVYSNAWIALSAAAQVWAHFRLFDAQPSWQPILLAFLSMFWVYTFAKAVHFDPEADALNDPERTAFLLKFRPILIGLGLLGLLLGIQLAHSRSSTTLGLFLAPLLAGLFYDLKFLPAHYKYRRLKDVTGVKGLVVASAWTLLTIGLPLQYGAEPSPVALFWVSLWSFLNWLVNTTYFDLGDLKGDRLESTQTIPVKYGFAATRRGLHALNLLALSCFLFAWVGGWLPQSTLPASLIAANNFAILWRAKDEDTDIGTECDVVADGVFVCSALYLILTR